MNSAIMHGKEPTDLPDLLLRPYDTGSNTVKAACTGPEKGLTSVKRTRAHVTAIALADDIDFIDTDDEELNERKSEPEPKPETNFRLRYQQQFKKPITSDNSNVKADQNANKETTSIENGVRPRKLSKNEITTEETTKIHQLQTQSAPGGKVNIIVRMISTTKPVINNTNSRPISDTINKNIEISKENISPNDNTIYAGNPNCTNDNKVPIIPHHLMTTSTILNSNTIISPDEYAGISNWKMENEDAYGMSVSLYEKNFITQESIGNPIADCYGLVMRGNSVAMALADGVNWGEFPKYN